jgi:hypothetical protein
MDDVVCVEGVEVRCGDTNMRALAGQRGLIEDGECHRDVVRVPDWRRGDGAVGVISFLSASSTEQQHLLLPNAHRGHQRKEVANGKVDIRETLQDVKNGKSLCRDFCFERFICELLKLSLGALLSSILYERVDALLDTVSIVSLDSYLHMFLTLLVAG